MFRKLCLSARFMVKKICMQNKETEENFKIDKNENVLDKERKFMLSTTKVKNAVLRF